MDKDIPTDQGDKRSMELSSDERENTQAEMSTDNKEDNMSGSRRSSTTEDFPSYEDSDSSTLSCMGEMARPRKAWHYTEPDDPWFWILYSPFNEEPEEPVTYGPDDPYDPEMPISHLMDEEKPKSNSSPKEACVVEHHTVSGSYTEMEVNEESSAESTETDECEAPYDPEMPLSELMRKLKRRLKLLRRQSEREAFVDEYHNDADMGVHEKSSPQLTKTNGSEVPYDPEMPISEIMGGVKQKSSPSSIQTKHEAFDVDYSTYTDTYVNEENSAESTLQKASHSYALKRTAVTNKAICMHGKKLLNVSTYDLNRSDASSSREMNNIVVKEETSNGCEAFASVYEEDNAQLGEMASSSRERDIAAVVTTIYTNAEQLAREVIELLKQRSSLSPMETNHNGVANQPCNSSDTTAHRVVKLEPTEQQGCSSIGANRTEAISDAVCMRLKELFSVVLDEMKRTIGAHESYTDSEECDAGTAELPTQHNTDSKVQQAFYPNEVKISEFGVDTEEPVKAFELKEVKQLAHNLKCESAGNQKETVDTASDTIWDELMSESSIKVEANNPVRTSVPSSSEFDILDAYLMDPNLTLPQSPEHTTCKKNYEEPFTRERVRTPTNKETQGSSSWLEQQWSFNFEREVLDELVKISDSEPLVTDIDEIPNTSCPEPNDTCVHPRTEDPWMELGRMQEEIPAVTDGTRHNIPNLPRDHGAAALANDYEKPSTSNAQDFFLPDYDWL